jgi:hypothetical protein
MPNCTFPYLETLISNYKYILKLGYEHQPNPVSFESFNVYLGNREMILASTGRETTVIVQDHATL